ncbi:uncharacterized protein PFL1_05426 [Pseudozyma flocculosa PF-1]|uniref:Uncharacterized protein n=1 Tax=Pseudozyma flocculosa PF-1 TaxID=1277687 RepID=A0A061H585_9BASI|nr:uncharacterized protein PFL1_05426 [Pseudozyma flocculosa PF-1]EPQ27145.1 hypothetical protein PFL1_05426 [Pseudozyma flocculosa PF-1]
MKLSALLTALAVAPLALAAPSLPSGKTYEWRFTILTFGYGVKIKSRIQFITGPKPKMCFKLDPNQPTPGTEGLDWQMFANGEPLHDEALIGACWDAGVNLVTLGWSIIDGKDVPGLEISNVGAAVLDNTPCYNRWISGRWTVA